MSLSNSPPEPEVASGERASHSPPTFDNWLHAVILRVTALDLTSPSLESPVAALLADPDVKLDKSGKLPLLTMQNLESLYFSHIWSLEAKLVPNFIYNGYIRAVDVHMNLINKCATADRELRLSTIHDLRILVGRFLVLLFTDSEIILRDLRDIREIITIAMVFNWHRESNVIMDLMMLSAPDPFGYKKRGTTTFIEVANVRCERYKAFASDNMPDKESLALFTGPLCSLISLSAFHVAHTTDNPEIDSVEYFPLLKDIFCFGDGIVAKLLPQFFFIAGKTKETAHPQDIEKFSILGPVLAHTWFAQEMNSRRLDAMRKVTRENDMYSISKYLVQERIAIKNHSENMFNLLNRCLRQSAFQAEFIRFLQTGIYLNRKRCSIHTKASEVGTFGFTQNISVILLRLSMPFVTKSFAALGEIDNSYLFSRDCIGLLPDITRLCSSTQEAEDYFTNAHAENRVSSSFNFITSCFFITLYWFHVGYVRNISEFWTILENIENSNERITTTRSQVERHRESNSAYQVEMLNHILMRTEKTLELQKIQRYNAECYLFDHQLQNETLQFYCFVSCWFLQLICGPEYAKQCPALPVPEGSPSEILAYIPEFFIEDLLSFIEFFCRFQKLKLNITYSIDNVLELLIVLLTHSSLIRNPHLRARIVDVIFHMTYHYGLMYIIGNHKVSINYLVPALMRFYVDVEQTGMSNQFYEKFNVRFNISKILQNVWQLASHRQRVIETSETYIFVRLVNMMMSDTRYSLDEGISKLNEIHRLHTLIASPEWTSMNQQAQSENQNSLQTAERHAKSFMLLASQTLETFKYLSGEIQRPFLTAEIVPRLAGMLDHNIAVLTGKQVLDLPVGLPEKFGFNRLKLLGDICTIFSNLSTYQEFIAAVGEDEHNYSREVLERARQALSSTDLISPKKLEKLGTFMDAVENYCAESKKESEDLGEIPEEFLDPIMCTLMENPVILPTSGTTVDRSTIIAYLLGDKRDPFNRKPLDPDDIIPNEELKKKITEFKVSRRASKTESKKGTD